MIVNHFAFTYVIFAYGVVTLQPLVETGSLGVQEAPWEMWYCAPKTIHPIVTMPAVAPDRVPFVLAKGTSIPRENIPRRGPLIIPPKLKDNGITLPNCSIMKTIAVEKTPRMTTVVFMTLLAVFSVVLLGIKGFMKSSQIVPERVFKTADIVL